MIFLTLRQHYDISNYSIKFTYNSLERELILWQCLDWGFHFSTSIFKPKNSTCNLDQ